MPKAAGATGSTIRNIVAEHLTRTGQLRTGMAEPHVVIRWPTGRRRPGRTRLTSATVNRETWPIAVAREDGAVRPAEPVRGGEGGTEAGIKASRAVPVRAAVARLAAEAAADHLRGRAVREAHPAWAALAAVACAAVVVDGAVNEVE